MDPEVGRELMLAAVLPVGTDRYIALYLGDPTDTGVEITLAGYARTAHQDWATTVPSVGVSVRANASPIAFASITDLGSADHWAIFDASVGGNLLRAGTLTDFFGVAFPLVFSGLGDDATFPINGLAIQASDV